MPKSETNGIGQKNNTAATSPIASRDINKLLNKRSMLRADYSDEPHTYHVEVVGTFNDCKYHDTRVYEEHHPLMAVGRAFLEFRLAHAAVDVQTIIVRERITKNKK